MSTTTFNSLDFRRALGSFATGIVVVTAPDVAGEHRGITVNSFSSVSLDPPLVSFCLDKAAWSFGAFFGAQLFAINILREDQQDLSVRFSTPAIDKWEGVSYDLWPGDLPVLRGCLANIGCRREQVHEGGDHVIIVGRVERLQADGEGDPLVFFRGGYRRIGPGV